MTNAHTQEAALSAPHPFAAAHSGLCATCEARFSEGELITRAPGGWSHAVCPEEKPMGDQRGDCFTHKTLNGERQC